MLNSDLTANRLEARTVWVKSRPRDTIVAVIALEDAGSLVSDHHFTEALAPNTALPMTDEARQILGPVKRGAAR